jgi:hypothetical protein
LTSLHWNVANSQSGAGVPNAEVSGTISYAGIFGLGATTSSFKGYTDSNGNLATEIDYLGSSGQVAATIAANSYNTANANFSHGTITGDVYYNVKLTPSQIPGGAPPGTGVGASVSGWFANLESYLGTLGTNAVVIIVVVLIVIAVIAVAFFGLEGESKVP